MGKYDTGPASLPEIIAALTARVEELERGNRAGYTSVDRGSLAVQNGGGLQIRDGGAVESLVPGNDSTHLYVGAVDYGGSPGNPAFITYRSDTGTPAFSVEGEVSQFATLRDNAGNIVLSDDASNSFGLDNPAIPTYWTTNFNVGLIAQNTSPFVAVQMSHFSIQHPRLHVRVLVQSTDGATTGQFRLTCNGVAISATVAIAGSAFFYHDLVADMMVLGPAWQGMYQVDFEMRRSAGAGTIQGKVVSSYGT